MHPFSDREWHTMEHIIRAWDTYQSLQQQHPDDDLDFRHHIHALQRIIMARPMWREHRMFEDHLP